MPGHSNPYGDAKRADPPARVSVGDVAPGSRASFTWNVRADKEGSVTITGEAFQNGESVATASHEGAILD